MFRQESDYRVDEELNRLVLEESELRDADAAKKASNDNDEKAPDDPGKQDEEAKFFSYFILSKEIL